MEPEIVEPASARALQIPHILSNVLIYLLRGTPKYRNLRLVNKLWADIGNDFVWEWTLPANLRRAPPELRQSFAKRVKHLIFITLEPKQSDTHNEAHEEFKDLHFPKLDSLTLDFRSSESKIPWETYLQPRMKSLSMAGVALTREVIHMIPKRCPHIRRASFFDIGPSCELFLAFVRKLEELSDLSLGIETVGMGEDLFQHLVGINRLKKLTIRDTRCSYHSNVVPLILDMKLFQSATQTNPKSFTQFEDLFLKSIPAVVRPLSARLRSIQSLHLQFSSHLENPQDVFEPLGTLQTLKDLTLMFLNPRGSSLGSGTPPRPDTVLCNSALLELGKLHSLESLEYRISPATIRSRRDMITDDVLAQLVRQMPGLTSLGLEIPGRLTISGLEKLGRSCPFLAATLLEGSFELDRLPDKTLPNVTTLSLRRSLASSGDPMMYWRTGNEGDEAPFEPVDPSGSDKSVPAFVDKMMKVVPRLQHLLFEAGDNYSRKFKRQVERDFRHRYGPECCRNKPDTDDEEDLDDDDDDDDGPDSDGFDDDEDPDGSDVDEGESEDADDDDEESSADGDGLEDDENDSDTDLPSPVSAGD